MVEIDASKITSEDALHDIFSVAFGFPDYYGRNMSAFVDCLSHLDEEENKIQVKEGEILVIQLNNIENLKTKYPKLYELIIETVAFVNWRRMEINLPAILALSFYK